MTPPLEKEARPAAAPATDTARELAELRERFRDFVYIVSHDFHAPLRNILGFSKLLQEGDAGPLSGPVQEYLRHISMSARLLQDKLDGLLVYSRLSSNPMAWQPQADMGALLQDCIDKLQPRMAAGGGVIETSPLPKLRVDPQRVSLLFFVLLDNALKFTKSGRPPKIAVTCREEEAGVWRIGVADNGVGIEPLWHEKAFDLFRCLHPSGSYPGVGIGLSLARRIVEQHGGKIWIESVPGGEGVEVAFTLRS